MPTAAAPIRTVRAKRRETAAPSSSLEACFWARQSSWEGLREGSWRCAEEALVGVEMAWWWRKHAVEAILMLSLANLGVVSFSSVWNMRKEGRSGGVCFGWICEGKWLLLDFG